MMIVSSVQSQAEGANDALLSVINTVFEEVQAKCNDAVSEYTDGPKDQIIKCLNA